MPVTANTYRLRIIEWLKLDQTIGLTERQREQVALLLAVAGARIKKVD